MSRWNEWMAERIAWADERGLAASLFVRVLAPMIVGLALGLGLVWLVVILPRPLGTALVLAVVVAILCWTVRELRWSRRMQEEIRRSWERLESEGKDRP